MTGKRRDWPGPSGRHTLQVELLPPHAVFARDRVSEGDFVKLSNVRIKRGNAGKMEGNIWADRTFPEKVQVSLSIEETQLRDLTSRRDKYWNANEKRDEQEVTKKQGKSAAKKQRRKEKFRKLTNDTDGAASTSSTVLHNPHGMFRPLAR